MFSESGAVLPVSHPNLALGYLVSRYLDPIAVIVGLSYPSDRYFAEFAMTSARSASC